jgi:hypothetical protein
MATPTGAIVFIEVMSKSFLGVKPTPRMKA